MKRDIWIFLFVLGALVFSWPLMTIFRENLAVSLFVVWLVFIVLMLIASIVSEREDRG